MECTGTGQKRGREGETGKGSSDVSVTKGVYVVAKEQDKGAESGNVS